MTSHRTWKRKMDASVVVAVVVVSIGTQCHHTK